MKRSNDVLLTLVCVAALGCADDSSGAESDDADTSLGSTVASNEAPAASGTVTSGPTSDTGVVPTSGDTAEPPGAVPTSSDTAEPPSAVPTSSDTSEPPSVEPTSSDTAEPPSVEPTSSDTAEPPSTGGSPALEPAEPTATTAEPEPSTPPDDSDVMDLGAAETFSFFVTSYHHIKLLSGRDEGFGGDLRWNGAATGLEGADALCQEMARRVSFGHRTWRAYLSTSTVNAIDRVGEGPWYDFSGALVAEDVAGLLVAKGESGGGAPGGGSGCVEGDTDRPAGGAMDCGTYDETGLLHDGSTDQDGDGVDDDDHDTMTATLADGTYAGFSCEDWTSTTAEPSGGGRGGGIMMGHTWPAGSGRHWAESHGGHACAAGTNFIQNGGGDSSTVGGGGGYGGFYCFATD
jgi:hypothetical protein